MRAERCIEYDAWIPIQHPLTGERVNVRAMVHDHLLAPAEVADLEGWPVLPNRRSEEDEGGAVS
jgi:hypothetical protein